MRCIDNHTLVLHLPIGLATPITDVNRVKTPRHYLAARVFDGEAARIVICQVREDSTCIMYNVPDMAANIFLIILLLQCHLIFSLWLRTLLRWSWTLFV